MDGWMDGWIYVYMQREREWMDLCICIYKEKEILTIK